jgi:putative RNA 2'-phosphotransferase
VANKSNNIALREDSELLDLLKGVTVPLKPSGPNYSAKIERVCLGLLRHKSEQAKLAHDHFGLFSLEQFKEEAASILYNMGVKQIEQGLESGLERLQEREKIEIRGNRIRALYGHSLPNIIVGRIESPPNTLWHTTAMKFMPRIQEQGLRKRARAFVHLTSSLDYIATLALSNSLLSCPVLLSIDTRKCLENTFRRPNSHVWLVDEIPPSAITIETDESRWWYKPVSKIEG